jgi:hypothetical protein
MSVGKLVTAGVILVGQLSGTTAFGDGNMKDVNSRLQEWEIAETFCYPGLVWDVGPYGVPFSDIWYKSWFLKLWYAYSNHCLLVHGLNKKSKFKQERQCSTYKVRLRRFRVTIVAVEKQ